MDAPLDVSPTRHHGRSHRKRGKRVALVVAAVTVLGGAVAAFVTREQLVEGWYLHRLRSSDSETSASAAAALGRRRSLRAVRPLLELAKGSSADATRDRRVPESLRSAAYGALWEMRDMAAPMVTRAVASDNDIGVRRTGVEFIREMGADAVCEVAMLVESPDPRTCRTGLYLMALLFQHWDEDADAIAAAIARGMAHRDPAIRVFTYRSFGSRVQAYPAALSELLEGLCDPDEAVRREAEEYFERYLVEDWRRSLEDAAPEARPEICLRLLVLLRRVNQRVGRAYSLSPRLIEAFERHPAADVRQAAVAYAGDYPEHVPLRAKKAEPVIVSPESTKSSGPFR